MTHNSLSSLQDAVDSLIHDGDFETPLEIIQAFVARIVVDPQAIGRVFSAPALDEICLRLGTQVLSQTNVAKPAPSERRIVYVATEFYRLGGHTLVAADFVRYQPDYEHVFLMTDILSNPHPDAPDLRLVPLGAKVQVAPIGNRLEKLKWLLTRIFELAPERIYWFNHHQDAVAIAAAQPATPGEKYFIHHADHQLCLGIHTPDLHHVDLANLGFFNCRDVLGLANNHYWPLVCDDLGPRDQGRRFIEAGRLRTCSAGSANKFEIPYLYDYADVLARVLRATGGDHIHMGHLSEEYLERIRRRLVDEAIPQERFIYVPWVPSLWRALIERMVDVYLGSWPIGGGKALIEAMGAGIPSIVHRNYISRFHSGFDLTDAETPTWHTPKELVERLTSLTSERLAAQSRSVRAHYEKRHTPQILASLLRGDTKDAPEPMPLQEYCPDTLQVFLDERARYDERVATLNRAVTEREGEFAQVSHALTERNIQVTGLNEVISQLNGQVTGLNEVISQLNGQIANLKQDVFERDGEIARLKQDVSERDGEIARLNLSLVAGLDRLAGEMTKLQATLLNGQLVREQEHLSQIIGERDRLAQERAQLEAELRAEQCLLEDSIRVRDREIHELAHSESYRFGLFCTWPFRKIWKGLRYFKDVQFPGVRISNQSNTCPVGPMLTRGAAMPIEPSSDGSSNGVATHPSLDIADPLGIAVKEVARPIGIDYSVAVPFEYRHTLCMPAPRLAVVCHIFYDHLTAEFRRYLQNIPFQFDLFISTDTPSKQAVIHRHFAGWDVGAVDVRLVNNRGRDIAPKLITFRDVYNRYEYVLHLHSKSSSHHASLLTHWRGFLLENLVGSRDIVMSIFEAFARYPDLGLVASQHFEPVRHCINWGGNFESAKMLASRMGITLSQDQVLDFPSGSMFWARSAALQPLLDLNLSFEDFPDESGRIDGTLAHAIEHLYYFVCERAGFRWIKIAQPELFGHTPAIVPINSPTALDRFLAEKTLMLTGNSLPAPRAQPIQGVPHSPGLVYRLQASALGVHLSVDQSTRVTVGIVTYRNSASQVSRVVESALKALERARLGRNGRILMIDNSDVSTAGLTTSHQAVHHLAPVGNIGFAAAHNRLMDTAFSFGTDIYIAANPDGAFHPGAIEALVQMMQAQDYRALIDAIQFPVEHPKIYDPVTFETPWASGACLAIPHDIFKKIRGFDDTFFMYCEDVDLSWRARAAAFTVRICPRAIFLHPVTNRPRNVEAVRMMFSSGIVLARKWGDIAFEKLLEGELHALGYPPPDTRPDPVSEEWRRIADFSHQFTFAKRRW